MTRKFSLDTMKTDYSKPATTSTRGPKAIEKKKPKIDIIASYKLTKPMKTLLNGVINSGKEDHWKMNLTGQKILPFSPTLAADLLPLIPEIRQVATDPGAVLADVQPMSISKRQGKTIRLKACVGTYEVFVNSDITRTGAFQCYKVRALTLSCKRYQNLKDVQLNWATLRASLFYDHNADPYEWDGRPQSFNLPVNRSLFTKHQDQTFILKRGAQYQVSNGTDGLGSAYMPIVHHTVHIKCKCKNKIIHYPDSDDVLPTDFAPFVVFLYTTMTGNNSNAINNSLTCHGSSKLIWETTA